MEDKKRKWVHPNDIITLKKPKKAREAASKVVKGSSVIPFCCEVGVATTEVESDEADNWTLRSKVRVCSDFDFDWMKDLRPEHEALIFSSINTTQQGDEDPLIGLQRSLLVWTHPHLPFLELFPRVMSPKSQVSSQLTSVQYDPLPQSYRIVIKDHWTAGKMALLAPTTSGLRHALSVQGVDFTMPLCSEKEHLEEVSSATSWLNQITTNNSINVSSSTRVASHSTSMVMVQQSHLRALVNFTLNSKLLVSSEGAAAGIPPTLLAPVPFLMATAINLNLKRSTVKEASGECVSTRYCVDVTGPILPHNLKLLNTALHHCHAHPYSVDSNEVSGTDLFREQFY